METKCPLEPPPPETPSTSEPPAPETPRVVDPPPETPRAADEVESTGPHADLVAAVAVAAREGAREAVVAAISELQPVLVQALCEQLAREPRGRQRSSSIRGRERRACMGCVRGGAPLWVRSSRSSSGIISLPDQRTNYVVALVADLKVAAEE